MKNTYSTQTAAAKMGVSFRTLNRWLARKLIRPSVAVPIDGGRTIWRWTEADIAALTLEQRDDLNSVKESAISLLKIIDDIPDLFKIAEI